MLALGDLVSPPCQDLELSGQAWQRQPVPASWPRRRQGKWQMRWGLVGRKGGKRGEVACGCLIESRSGLSWWVVDDREGMEGRGRGGLQGLWQPYTARRVTTSSGAAFPTPPLLPCSLSLSFLSHSPPFFCPLSFLTTKEPGREACLPGTPEDVRRLVKASFQSATSQK